MISDWNFETVVSTAKYTPDVQVVGTSSSTEVVHGQVIIPVFGIVMHAGWGDPSNGPRRVTWRPPSPS